MGQIVYDLLLIVVLVLLITFREKISPKQSKIEKIMFIVLIISRLSRFTVYFIDGTYAPMIPLHLCTIAAYMSLIACVWKPERAKHHLFFYAFMGFSTLIEADPRGGFSFSNPLIYGFVIDHFTIMLVPFYMIIFKKYRPEFKHLLWPSIVLFGMLLMSIPLNSLHETFNFFEISTKPVFSDLFTSTNDFYFILAFMFAFFVFSIVGVMVGRFVYDRLK